MVIFLCFVDRASLYNLVNKANLVYNLFLVALVVATKEIGLEVNADKTKYMIMSRDQNAGRSHSMKIGNSCIERVEEFKYLGTTLTNQNSIPEKLRAD